MAIYYSEEANRIICPKCHGRYFYERPIHAYLKANKICKAQYIKTLLICENCHAIADEVLKDNIERE